MPKCATETFELDVTRKELAVIFSDAEQRDDNSKVSPELGKAAIDGKDIKNIIKVNSADNGAVDFCNQALGSYGKSLDYINKSPLETVQAIGNSLQHLREYKTKEICE